MNVYDFAPDLDLSKEVEGSIFRVRGIEGGNGVVYAKVVSCADVKDYSCERCIFYDYYKDKCSLSRSDSCIDGDCGYEQAAIEGGGRRRLGLRPADARQSVGQDRSGTVYCGT